MSVDGNGHFIGRVLFSDSFKKILMCLSGVAIKLQEGDYDAQPPPNTVSFSRLVY